MPFYGTGPLLFEDTFAYSDGNLVTVGSAKWNEGYFSGQTSLRVLSGKAAGPATTVWRDNYSKAIFSVGVAGIEFIMNNITPHASATHTYNFFLASNPGVAAPSGYALRWRTSGGGYDLYKRVGSTLTTLMTPSPAVVPVNGDSCAVQLLPNGSMSLWRKPSGGSWAQVGTTVTDTTFKTGFIVLETTHTNTRWDSVEVREVPSNSKFRHWSTAAQAWVTSNWKRHNGSIWVPASFKKF